MSSSSFEEAIYTPIMHQLRYLCRPPTPDDAFDTRARSLKKLTKIGVELNLAHLGTYHTLSALRHLGLAEHEMPWVTLASQALHSQSARSVGPPHQRDIAAWVAYDLELDIAGIGCTRVSEPGRVVHFATGVNDLHDTLRPLTIDHSRAGHAERIALLEILAAIEVDEKSLRRRSLSAYPGNSPSLSSDTWASVGGRSVTGTVYLFAGHTPCLSCVAVFAQFARSHPHVKLSVAFQDSRIAATLTKQTP